MAAVTGNYRDAQGDPASGYIRFTLKPPALTLDGEQVVCSPVYAILDPAGHLAVDLIPDSELVVDGVAVYEVAEYLDGCHRTWHLALVDDQPVDLPSRYPGDPAGDVAVLPVPGPQGPQGLVAVDSTVTGAPGSDALVEDLDPADTSALLRFTIPSGQPGQDGTDGRGAEWEQAATWAALPASGNWPGRKMQVMDGLGLCLAVWDGAGWRVDPQSDTGRLPMTTLLNDWTGGLWLHRDGGKARIDGWIDSTDATSFAVIQNIPLGWRAGSTPPYPVGRGNRLSAPARGRGIQVTIAGTLGTELRVSMFADDDSKGATAISIAYRTTDPWPTTPPA